MRKFEKYKEYTYKILVHLKRNTVDFNLSLSS